MTALALPAAASADWYCASVSPSFTCPGQKYPTVQAALDAAQTHAGSDTVWVEPGTWQGPFSYDSSAGGPLELDGIAPAGSPAILTSSGSAPVLTVTGSSPVVITGLGVSIPATSTKGMSIGGGGATLTRMSVTAPSNASGVTGIAFSGGPLGGSAQNNIANSSVDLPRTGGNIAVRDSATGVLWAVLSRLSAATGVSATDVAVTVDDVTIHAGQTGVAVNATFASAPGPYVELRHDTIVGDPGSGTGVDISEVESGIGADIRHSIVTDFPTSIRANAAVTGTANVHTYYSDYGATQGNVDPNDQNIHGTVVDDGHHTSAAPRLASPSAGDFHLRADSPLIDAGNPAHPTEADEPSTDPDGSPRVLEGNGVAPAVTDIGAYEFVRHPPKARAAQPASAAAGDPTTFDGSASTDPDPGEHLTYRWTFDDGSTAGGAVARHAFAQPGLHTVTLKVTDLEHQSDSTAVKVGVTVAPKAALTASKIPVVGDTAFTPIKCPAGVAGGCVGTVTFQVSGSTATPVVAAKKRKKKVTIGKKSFTAPPGKPVTVKVTLLPKGVDLLKKHHKLVVDATVSSTDKRHHRRKRRTHRKVTLFAATQPF